MVTEWNKSNPNGEQTDFVHRLSETETAALNSADPNSSSPRLLCRIAGEGPADFDYVCLSDFM